MSTKIAYSYLSENVPFHSISRRDFTRLGNSFKQFYNANHDSYPFYWLQIPSEKYEEIAHIEYDSKDALFEDLDKACYLENGSDHEKINTRKILIGIYQNVESWLEKDEEFGDCFFVDTHDPLWAGVQDMDGFYIHYRNGIWFIDKMSSEEKYLDEMEDNSEFWDDVSNTKASAEDADLKRYYLERDNI